jgi:hypothetical protein
VTAEMVRDLDTPAGTCPEKPDFYGEQRRVYQEGVGAILLHRIVLPVVLLVQMLVPALVLQLVPLMVSFRMVSVVEYLQVLIVQGPPSTARGQHRGGGGRRGGAWERRGGRRGQVTDFFLFFL